MEYKPKVAIFGANSILAQALYDRLVGSRRIVYQVYNTNVEKIAVKKNLFTVDGFFQSGVVPEILFFFSSVIDFKEDIATLENIIDTNILLLNKISAKFPDAKIIHSSSVSVYGPVEGMIDETTATAPKSSYSFSKLWAEFIVRSHSGGGVNIRLSSLFGPQMKMNTFLPLIIQHALRNKEITLYGKGERRQDYISAREASEYFYKAMEFDGDMPLLAVHSKSYSNYETALIVSNMIGDVKITFTGEDDSPGFVYDNSRTKKALGMESAYTFDTELKETILWIIKQF